jgi:hypothetical protein
MQEQNNWKEEILLNAFKVLAPRMGPHFFTKAVSQYPCDDAKIWLLDSCVTQKIFQVPWNEILKSELGKGLDGPTPTSAMVRKQASRVHSLKSNHYIRFIVDSGGDKGICDRMEQGLENRACQMRLRKKRLEAIREERNRRNLENLRMPQSKQS